MNCHFLQFLHSRCSAYENWWQPPEEVIVIKPREEKQSSSAPAQNNEVNINSSGNVGAADFFQLIPLSLAVGYLNLHLFYSSSFTI